MEENKSSYNTKTNTKQGQYAKSLKPIIFKTLACAVAVGAVGFGAYTIVEASRSREVSFTCEGVDENWLVSHPFNTNNYPKTFNQINGVNLDTPEIAGYKFISWHLKGDTKEITEKNYKVSLYSHKPLELVAKFEPIQYQITMNLNGGHLVNLVNNTYQGHIYAFDESNPNSVSTTYVCTDSPFSLPKCEREGYDFDNNEWKLVDSENLLNTVTPSNDLNNFSVKADFTLHPYAISYKFEGEGVEEFESEIISNNIHSFDYEKTVPFTEPYLEGYTFEGWFDAEGNQITSIRSHTVPTNDVFKVTGKFKPIEYKIMYSDRSNSDLSAFPKSFKRCSNDISIPDISPDGYVFHGWVSSNVTILQYTSKIEHGSVGNITLTAALDLIPYKVTFAIAGVDDDFKDTFNLKTKVINYNVESDTFELPEATCTGYTFVNFTDEDENEITEIEKGTTGDKVITANFVPTEYKITRSYRLHDEDQLVTLEDKYTIETAQFSLPSPSSDIKTFVGWYETVTKKRYAPSTKFGRGIIGDYVFEAEWSLNGKGTAADPYQIFTANQLEQISDMTSYYKLMNDIEIVSKSTDVWIPVGTSDNPFNGTFDGNNKRISFFINASSKENDNFVNYFGLFGYAGTSSEIKNFTVDGSVGTTEDRFVTNLFGAVCASSKGKISNITQNASINVTSTSTTSIKIGGIVGDCEIPNVKDCTIGDGTHSWLDVDAPLTSTVYCGGVVGFGKGGVLSNCIVNITINCNALNNCFAGGILGSRASESATHIDSSTLPTSSNPFSGQVLTSVVAASGNRGMAQYEGGKKAIIGEQAYEGLLGSTISFEVNHYYYVFSRTEDLNKPFMCWMKYLGEGLFDSDNPINPIIF